jgi:hypothetical protein
MIGSPPIAYTSEKALLQQSGRIVRIIDYRHEKNLYGDDAGAAIDLPDRRVVARLGADEELRIGLRRRHLRQKLPQHGGCELAAAAAAMGETGQAIGDVDWNVHRFALCNLVGPDAPTGVPEPVSISA